MYRLEMEVSSKITSKKKRFKEDLKECLFRAETLGDKAINTQEREVG